MFTVKMITPEGLYRTINTDILNVDSTDGQRGILTNHMPIVLMLKIGSIGLNEDGKRKKYTVAGGMMYFENNVATILSDAIEDYDDIDLARAQSAKERAQKRLNDKSEDLDVIRAQLALSKAINRIRAKGME